MREIDLKEKQNIEINILKEFKRICTENNLKYYLAYGTLLGAVRNQKIIPWDDDVDVIMPREDYMKLLEIFPTESNYKLLSIYNVKSYYYPFLKIVDKRTKLEEKNFNKIQDMGVYIDVFPIDGLPTKHRFFELQMFILKEMLKLSYVKNFKSSSIIVSLLKIILCPIPKIIGYEKLVNKLDKKARTHKIKDSEKAAVTIDYVPIKKNIIQKKQLEGQKIIFEKEEYMTLKQPETTLKLLYGEQYIKPVKKVDFWNNIAYLKDEMKVNE